MRLAVATRKSGDYAHFGVVESASAPPSRARIRGYRKGHGHCQQVGVPGRCGRLVTRVDAYLPLLPPSSTLHNARSVTLRSPGLLTVAVLVLGAACTFSWPMAELQYGWWQDVADSGTRSGDGERLPRAAILSLSTGCPRASCWPRRAGRGSVPRHRAAMVSSLIWCQRGGDGKRQSPLVTPNVSPPRPFAAYLPELAAERVPLPAPGPAAPAPRSAPPCGLLPTR